MLDFLFFLWGKTADEGSEETLLFPSVSDSIAAKDVSVKKKKKKEFIFFTAQTLWLLLCAEGSNHSQKI